MDERKDKWKQWFWWLVDERWRWLTVAAWLMLCAWLVFDRWNDILAFALGDTDDNLRMSQVRALLAGQDWYDLRQYKLNPPTGANVHWSRLVDLPLAGIILLLRPLIGNIDAERTAIAIAPLIPLLVLMFALALTTRRLVHPRAYPLAFVALFYASSTLGMFNPTRLDHHGWQLAMVALVVTGLSDPKRRRGGVTAGIASALSLAVGLEMLIYIALAGAAQVLFWIVDREERSRLASYAASLGGGVAFGFLVFASYANRLPICDALSPVWLSNALLGSGLLLALTFLSPADWRQRLGLAAVAGLTVAAFHAVVWPQCLSRLEGVSPEVYELWLSHVREARPVYRHGWDIAPLVLALPVTGLFGWLLLAWRNQRDRDLLRRTLAAAAPAIVAGALLMWQTRTGPAAQMLAIPGAISIIVILAPWMWSSRSVFVRVLGVVSVVVIGAGAAVPLAKDRFVPPKQRTQREIAIARANRSCNMLWAFRPVAQQPKGLVFAFVDMGPRIITVTHHNAITGPYHRNGEQIADVMKAFRGPESQARAIIAGKYHADYLLTCPHNSTTTIFLSEAPKGFFAQLNRGDVPDWLQPIELPQSSPFNMWRVLREA